MSATTTIGRLASRTGVAASALRYYEEQGLVTPVARTAAGYRLYDEESVARVRFIQRAQSLGLSLAEIHELLAAADGGDPVPTAERLRHLVAHKLSATRLQVQELEHFAKQLETVYLRLGQSSGGCRCHHLGDCDCVSLQPGADELNRMEQEVDEIAQGPCLCGCEVAV